jgi:hypothetical protein
LRKLRVGGRSGSASSVRDWRDHDCSGARGKGDNRSFLGTDEGAALVRGFLAIKEKSIRQNLIDFIGILKTK